MKIGIIGRTHILIETTKMLIQKGHKIGFIYTCRAESHYKANESDFKKLAEDIKCPFFDGLDVNANLYLLKETNVDICVSINWMTLLEKKFLSLFKYGVLNAHAGDLPLYKGNACPNWAILNFEDRVGLTIHRMTEELDSGPFLKKAFFSL